MRPGGGAANHFFTTHESERGGRGMGGVGGADDKLVEHKVEGEIGREPGLDVPFEQAIQIRQGRGIFEGGSSLGFRVEWRNIRCPQGQPAQYGL